MLKYVDYPGTCVAFYRQGLGSLDRVARARHGVAFPALEPAVKSALVGEIARQQPPGWQGPPSQLFYFIIRGDAVDVVYGTRQGYARLEVPYMAHIAPPKAW